MGASWGAFADNGQSERAYGERRAQGRCPVFKGHTLTPGALVLRPHSLHILCGFQTQWTPEEEELVDFGEILENLQEMQEDGLVELDGRQIVVSPSGRPFVRNICMAFDLKLHRKKPETRIFSMTV